MPRQYRAAIDVTLGACFGRLIVTQVPDRLVTSAKCACVCSCGNTVLVTVGALRYDNTKSCGCLRADKLREMRLSHGATRFPKAHPIKRTFDIWTGMRSRCNNPKNPRFHVYGGRGISYDPSWENFENFLQDMGACPEGYSIEREHNDGHYCKANCYWLPRPKQSQNRQDTIWIRYQGQDWCFKRLCEYLGKKYLKTYKRYVMRDWPLSAALDLAPEQVLDLQRIDSPQGF